MIRLLATAALATLGAAPLHAASLTLGTLVDAEEGTAFDADGRFALTPDWSVGAGFGRSEAQVGQDTFSGNSLRASTDVNFGAMFLGASAQRWKDSGQVRSTVLEGELGWMGATGLSVSALVADRSLRVTYSANVLGQVRERQVDFEGSGFGGDVSWFGQDWSLGARFIDYQYGRSVARVRDLLAQPGTVRFPRLQYLVESVATRAAGAPDRTLSVFAARDFSRSSLQGDWNLQRDALTGEEVHSVSLTLGYRVGARVEFDTTVGFTDGDATDAVAWAGLAVTLRTAPR